MKKKIEKICLGLLALPLARIKAYVNLVMSSCSSLGVKSVVELSANRHFHYHYSNISKVSKKLTKNEADYEKTCKILRSYFLSSCQIVAHESVGLGSYYRFGQDMCRVEKAHSPCLEGKVYGHSEFIWERYCGRLQS